MNPRTHPAATEATPSVLSTRWLAAVLIGSSLVELVILRLGTRTAVHIPGIEEIRRPYQIAAATGRLAFYVAVVVLALLLGRLAHNLHHNGQTHLATGVFAFGTVAVLGALNIVRNDVMAPVTTSVVILLGATIFARRQRPIDTVIAVFALAFVLAATAVVLQEGASDVSTGILRRLTLWSESLAVLAAIGAGPLVRRSLGLPWVPSRRLICASAATGLVIAGAALANPSTTHILMLWNFGLTGALPATAYGLAAASLVIAVTSAARHGHQILAAALTLLTLGGIGLISTYQSALVIAGLAMVASAPGNRLDQTPTSAEYR